MTVAAANGLVSVHPCRRSERVGSTPPVAPLRSCRHPVIRSGRSGYTRRVVVVGAAEEMEAVYNEPGAVRMRRGVRRAVETAMADAVRHVDPRP